MALLEIRKARRESVTPEGRRLAALDGVDLDVGANEFVTSGCGKTTLLRLISGFGALDGGAVRLDGADLSARAPVQAPGEDGVSKLCPVQPHDSGPQRRLCAGGTRDGPRQP